MFHFQGHQRNEGFQRRVWNGWQMKWVWPGAKFGEGKRQIFSELRVISCFFFSKLLPLKSTSSMKDWCFGGIRKTNRDLRASFFVDVCSHMIGSFSDPVLFQRWNRVTSIALRRVAVWRVVILFQEDGRNLRRIKMKMSRTLETQSRLFQPFGSSVPLFDEMIH